MKRKKLNNSGITILSADKRRASVKLHAQLPSVPADEAAKKVLAQASLWNGENRASVSDNVEVPASRPVLTDERYVYKDFRALSQTLLSNRGLDFSAPGVLEAAVPMLLGKTVYPNHDFTDINNWIGVVSNASWDAAGAQSGGVPGINCQVKLDAYLNYRIACGVLMEPPAINAMSLTVCFEFEYSHPQIAMENKWKFFDLLGEEVDGEIVRLIVTNIVEIWEASLVFLGEDRMARGMDDDESDDGEDDDDPEEESLAAAKRTPNASEEKKTMKLTTEQKTKLGIEFDGDDVPETDVLTAGEALAERIAALTAGLPENVDELKAQAAAGVTLVTRQRSEVTRLAKLAELGAAEGDLDEVVTGQIAAADADGLIKLEAYFTKRVADRFPAGGRSSQEDSLAVDNAGGVTTEETAVRTVGVL